MKELHFKKRIPTIEILVVNSTWTSSFDLKNRLLKEGFKENKCEICNLKGVWNNKPINMQLDHAYEVVDIVCNDQYKFNQNNYNNSLKKQALAIQDKYEKEFKSKSYYKKYIVSEVHI